MSDLASSFQRAHLLARASLGISILTAHSSASAQGLSWSAANPGSPQQCGLIRSSAADALAGSVAEDDARISQLLRCSGPFPIPIRPLSPAALRALRGDSAAPSKGIELTQSHVLLWYNSERALNEGQRGVWLGRGLTLAASSGALARVQGSFGSLELSVRPLAFISQNQPYVPIAPTPPTDGHFANPFAPSQIDQPYRFGAESYGRMDSGDTWIRYDTRVLAFGISSAAQVWGPARFSPLVLGAGAGGFAHGFVETPLPWSIPFGRIGGRIVVGRLERSAFAPQAQGNSSRLGTGIVGVFTPGFFPGLELGASRFFHRRWPESGLTWGVLAAPFEGFLKNRFRSKDAAADNQLASAFFRIMAPRGALEIYGEMLREDHSADSRDLAVEVEHASAFMLGARKLWGFEGPDGFSATIEIVNGMNPNDFKLRRDPNVPLYTHYQVLEGHTHRGLFLGAPGAFGGTDFRVTVERFTKRDRSGISWQNQRSAYNRPDGTWNGQWLGFNTLAITHRSYGELLDVVIGLAGTLDWAASASSSRGNVSTWLSVIAPHRNIFP